MSEVPLAVLLRWLGKALEPTIGDRDLYASSLEVDSPPILFTFCLLRLKISKRWIIYTILVFLGHRVKFTRNTCSKPCPFVRSPSTTS